jgi:membrane protein YdbS with pleckstrin-like domain
MQGVTKKYGCGRAMWEYSDTENRFGTPEALMLLPYWTNGCVDSMEGLLFESSATTPYHFINQAELSQGPSQPEVGLPYGPLDVSLGVQHLQLLGVKYFIAETPAVEQEAAADPSLQLVAQTGPWAWEDNGTVVHTTWEIYVVRNSALVTPLRNEPAVLSGVNASPASWLGPPYHGGPSLNWYGDPSLWNVELAQSGPASWPRTPVDDIRPAVKPVPSTHVTSIRQTNSTVSFHVSRTGTPVLVKVSYFPNWHASGANGPYRVTPNLMVVVPTSHDVTLTYGRSFADDLGQAHTVFGLVVLVVLFVVPAVRRWRVKKRAA